MPVYSFITSITAPDREAAEAAASEIRVSAEEGIEAAIQDDEVPEGVEVEHGELVGDILFGYLDLSTAHLTQDTMDKMQRGDNNWPAMSIGIYPHGFFVTVPDQKEQDLSGLPEDLAAVMHYAQQAGAYVVRFDSDGHTVDDLPVYDEDDKSFRAAYWTNGHADVLLTGEHQKHLSDEELLAAARREADENRLDVSTGNIVVGRWNP